MLQQNEQVKIEKFIETMPTIIQTHSITEPNWAEVIKKAKNLEHIIRKLTHRLLPHSFYKVQFPAYIHTLQIPRSRF